jgi:hypothetical protein
MAVSSARVRDTSGSDEPFRRVVQTSGSDELVSGVSDVCAWRDHDLGFLLESRHAASLVNLGGTLLGPDRLAELV